jgi:thiol-disulfide isomerase/thioredoxin
MEIGEAEFNDKIARGVKFVADFYAVWCPPCQKFAPIFEKASALATATPSPTPTPSPKSTPSPTATCPPVDFVKIDVDRYPELAEQFGVRSIPTIILFDNGSVVDTHIGTFGTPNEVLAFARVGKK